MSRPAPVVTEVAADVAEEDMAEAAVEEDMEVEAMAVAVAVVDMEVTFSSIYPPCLYTSLGTCNE